MLAEKTESAFLGFWTGFPSTTCKRLSAEQRLQTLPQLTFDSCSEEPLPKCGGRVVPLASGTPPDKVGRHLGFCTPQTDLGRQGGRTEPRMNYSHGDGL